MNFDDLLRETLADERWVLAAAPDALERVRRAHVTRRRRRTALGVVLVGTALGGSALAVGALGDGGSSALLVPAAPSSAATPTPIPGSTPAYTPLTARAWFLSKDQAAAFFAGYRQPSPQPGDSVPSPHASG
ncbi:MAG: hypothetical protein QOE58_488, partial [Actinomycetota bacterium]|nr:hypothetical protein [Actinomycetota bacterium]